MAKTSIEWAQFSWNPIVGCSVLSPGCKRCYAMSQASRLVLMARGAGLSSHYEGTVERVNGNAVWTGKLALAPDSILLAPLKRRQPTTWFVNSMGDLFHEDVPDEWIDRVFAVMALTPQHTHLVLTKRAARMRAYVVGAFDRIVRQMMNLVDAGVPPVRITCERLGLPYVQPTCADDWYPLRNVWLGVSAEDQRRADERVPELLGTPAAIRFVSAEPLLGNIDFTWIAEPNDRRSGVIDALAGRNWIEERAGPASLQRVWRYPGKVDQVWKRFVGQQRAKLDWIIVGGESGQGARNMEDIWAEDILAQCAASGARFFMKQMGGPVKARMRPIPEHLAVRETPEPRS